MARVRAELVAPLEREPLYVLRLADDPPAGSDFTLTVPGESVYELVLLRAQLVAGAAVGDRQVALALDDGTSEVFRWVAGDVQTAGQTRDYQLAAGIGFETPVARLGVFLAAIPRLPLAPGFRFRSITANLQTADNWAAPRLYVRETPTLGPSLDVPALAERLAVELEG